MMKNLKSLPSRIWQGWRTLPDSTPQRWFAVVALAFGVIFAVISVPFDAPDEFAHLARAYNISKGQLTAQKTENGKDTGGYLPASFRTMGEETRQPEFGLKKVLELGNVSLEPHKLAYHGYPNLAIYSPMVYAPQATGLAVGEALRLSAFHTLVLARIFNVVIYTLLLYWTIRLLPFGKWAAVIVGLLPMHIFLAGSMSADPVSIGIISLGLAVVLHLRDRGTRLTRREYAWLLVLVAAIAHTKLPYPLLLATFLLLPVHVLGGTIKQRWLMLGGAALTAAITAGLWLVVARATMVHYSPLNVIVDPSGQLMHMLQYPTAFIKAFIITYGSPASDGFLQNYVISVGPVRAWFPVWMTYAYTVFLVAAFVGIRSASKATLNRVQKQILAAAGVLVLVAISVLLYMSWTPVGAPIIEGMQSRYFTPLLLLLIPLLALRATRNNEREGLLTTAWYRYVPVVFLLAAVLAAFYYFYTIKVFIPF